jgi:hypothetical protein
LRLLESGPTPQGILAARRGHGRLRKGLMYAA